MGLMIGPHSKVFGKNANPERVMFNFETVDVNGEFERMKSVGTQVVQEPYHPSENQKMTIATLADIDGNYFQLVTPWK